MTSAWKVASVTSTTYWPGRGRRRLGGAGGRLVAGLDRREVDRAGHRRGDGR